MRHLLILLAFSTVFGSLFARADHPHSAGSPDAHAPIGVMGDHRHRAGEWMFSYRYMRMSMEDNVQGSDDIDAERIVTTLSNPFAPPPTVRVVPLSMDTDMHMFGAMYAPNDKVTLMAMANYIERSMDHVTFAGMMGANPLGQFTTEASGLGDTQLSALIGLPGKGKHQWHANIGVSLPTGSITERDSVLTPMGMRMDMRLPYAMQLGSGTYDVKPGLTYNAQHESLSWGAQYISTWRLDDNKEAYALGNRHDLTTWGAYRWSPTVSSALRLIYEDVEDIKGRDSNIMAPVQTANPNNYGGERWDIAASLNWLGQRGALHGYRAALEYQHTVAQHAHGVQMQMQSMLTVGLQKAF